MTQPVQDVRAAATPKPTTSAPSSETSRGSDVKSALRGKTYEEGAAALAPQMAKIKPGSAGAGAGAPQGWSKSDTVMGGKASSGFDFKDLETRIGKAEALRGQGKLPGDTKSGGGAVFAGASAAGRTDKPAEGSDAMFGDSPVGTTDSRGTAGVFAGAGAQGQGFVRNTDDWLAGGRAGVGAMGSARAGIGGHAATNVATEGGPKLGSIDPDTNERKGMLSAQAGAGVEAFAGAQVNGVGEAYVQGLGVGAAGQVDAFWGAKVDGEASAGAGVEIGGMQLAGVKANASGSASAGTSAQANGEVQAGIGTTVLGAKGSASVEAVGAVEGSASAGGSLAGINGTVNANGTLEAGGGASAGGEVAVGPASMGARGEAEAWVGARASGSIGASAGALGVDFLSFSLNGSVMAGAGAGIAGGLMLKNGVLYIDAELLAATGVGGSVGVSVALDLLFPYHVLMKMLEANGVMTARPENHIPEILGYILKAKQVKGTSEAPDFATGRSVCFNRSQDDAFDAFEAAGAKVDRDAGTVDTRGKDVDPMALVGELPGEMGKRYDAALGSASDTIGDAHAEATAAPKELGESVKSGIEGAFSNIVELVNNAMAVCKNTGDMVQALLTANVAGALEKGAALIQSAWQTAQAAIAAATNWIARLFQWLGSLFAGFDQAKNDQGAALVKDVGLVFQAAGALASGNQAQLAGLAPQLANVASRFAGDGGKAAQDAGAKAKHASTSVAGLDGKTIDLGEFSGRLAVSSDARKDYAEVAGLVSNEGQTAAQKTAGQIEKLPDKLGSMSGDVAMNNMTAAQSGTGKMRQTFDGKRNEADQVVKDNAPR